MRTILHVDMNNFYASVECLYRPEIRNKPVAVTGDIENRHGIVLAKNMIAKKLGVTTGEAIWQAKNKAPGLVCVPPDYSKYLRFSRLARTILYDYTDQIEAFGLDENWADVSGSLGIFGSGIAIAEAIRERVKKELGVTVSIGLSWNKIFAKIGSDYKKPDAITIITKDNYQDIVWPLPVSDLLYVGRATANKLNRRAIYTIGDLAARDPVFLKLALGKWGLILSDFARGLDNAPVRHIDERAAIKSIGNSITAPRDLTNDLDARLLFICLAESVAARLRENMLKCTGVEISIRDNTLYTVTRQMKLPTPTACAEDLIKAAMELLYRHYDFYSGKRIRSMGLRGINLVTADSGLQLSLFDCGQTERKDKLAQTVDELRRRYGHQAIFRAACLLDTKLTGVNIKDEHTIHPVSYFR
ncbi:MAG: DNA polymerase IV [Phascolarctobacterium sp.]|nr:MAG: DNA polymerase IV [Phascolarctobacterium sp.]